MKIEINEMVLLEDKEIETLKKAIRIIGQISDGLTECTAFIDNQTFPDEVENLITMALFLEDRKIYSTFNNFNKDERLKLTRLISERRSKYGKKILD